MMLEKQPKRHTEKQRELKWPQTIRAVKEKEMRQLKSFQRKQAMGNHLVKVVKRKARLSSRKTMAKMDSDKVLMGLKSKNKNFVIHQLSLVRRFKLKQNPHHHRDVVKKMKNLL
jgi:hypothetical protein